MFRLFGESKSLDGNNCELWNLSEINRVTLVIRRSDKTPETKNKQPPCCDLYGDW